MIEAFMAPPNFVLVEDIEDRIPEEFSEKLKDVNWDDVTFTTFSICDTSMLDYEITSDGDIYIREENLLEKSEHTGAIELHSLIQSDDSDIELTFKALFFKGCLKEFGLEKCKEVDSAPRKKAQKEVIEAVRKEQSRKKSFWFKLLKLYRNIIEFVFTFFRWFLAWLIKICWFIQSKIT